MSHRTLLLLGAVLLLAASGLWGSEEGAATGGGGMEFFGKVVNFAVLFGGLAFLLVKPLRAMLRNRTEEIRRALEDSEAEKRRAGEKLEEARARLANLASEVDAVKKAAEAEGRAEQENIRRLAADEAEKIRRLAKADMEAQVRAGILALKRHAAALAVERALERIRGRLTPETHTVLIERSIEDLATSDEKKGPDPKIRPGAH